jgi:hypothetical protein
MKPLALQQVEGALWRSILRMVSGTPAVTELSSFIQEYHLLSRGLNDNSPEVVWFQMPYM